MVSDRDIYRSARELIKHHCDAARSKAASRAADLAVTGDQLGALTFKRIVEAIRELQRTERSDAETVN